MKTILFAAMTFVAANSFAGQPIKDTHNNVVAEQTELKAVKIATRVRR